MSTDIRNSCSYARCLSRLPPYSYHYGPPQDQGDDILGLYGLAYSQFVRPTVPCPSIFMFRNNQSPLFYHNIQTQVQPTYGFLYKGQDYLFRTQALL